MKIQAVTRLTTKKRLTALILILILILFLIPLPGTLPTGVAGASGSAGLIGAVGAASASAAGETFDAKDSVLICFVTTACAECAQAEIILSGLPETVALPDGTTSPVVVRHINVTEAEGFEAVHLFFEAYAVPTEEQSVPILFYANGYLPGAAGIEASVTRILADGEALGFIWPKAEGGTDAADPLGLSAVFLAGLLGGVNPCSVSMLLLLLSLLAAKSARLMKIGFSYLAGKFLAYLIIGLSLFSAFSAAGLLESERFLSVKQAVRILVIAAASGLAVFNVFDFWNARKENYGRIRVQLPKALRRFNNRLIERFLTGKPQVAFVTVFVLGLIVSAGEFLCTGQIYLAAILYQARTHAGDTAAAGFSLLLYCVASMIPAVVLIVLCGRGKRALELSEATRKNMPLIKLANAVLFAGIAAATLFFF
ncbi:MAG: hypothetical protein LBU58_07655 [Clostridiales bacterium]|jgi:hypothetical protein|nr:hypothetical protein [Clostridiales bacterium]